MIVSVASGKGGTGKTTVSAALVSVWDRPFVAVDLDVEEPNLHLFLRPEVRARDTVFMEVPVADSAACTLCRACVELCQFKAIAIMGTTLMLFPEMCHGCGGCLAICPAGALSPGSRELGELVSGRAGQAEWLMGLLRVGEAMSPPLMREAKSRLAGMLAAEARDAIIDAPPGVSCPAVSAVLDSDVILLVTEPTPFGYYDFSLAVEAFAPLGKPMAAVINRAGIGDDAVKRFCQERGLPILAEIPYDRDIAQAYARGELVTTASPELRQVFCSLRDGLRSLLQEVAAHA